MVKQETIDKYKTYIGKNFGCIHVDSLDLSKASKNRIYFYCTCTKCGRKIKVRSDGFTGKPRVGCKHCMGKWRKEHFEKIESEKLIPKQIRIKYSHFKCNAINRDINFDLTYEQVCKLCSQPCIYCGKKESLGIDRIDNSKGYTVDNCVPCCGCCNKMKMDLEPNYFISQIEKIYSRLDIIKCSSTISKESTSKTIVDGNGVHLRFKNKGGDIVKSV